MQALPAVTKKTSNCWHDFDFSYLLGWKMGLEFRSEDRITNESLSLGCIKE